MTISIEGKYYSGATSAVSDVSIQVDSSGQLIVDGCDLPPTHWQDLNISTRVGNSARYLGFPGGGKIETRANHEIDILDKQWGNKPSGLAHRLENSRSAVWIAVLTLVVGIYAFFVYGLPAMGTAITASLPTSLDDRLGGEVMEQLDDFVFEPSLLPRARQSELTARFDALIPDNARNYRIDFRSGGFLGANAFALPDAQVIFTDELVELSEDDDMMAAIMLHEIGHIVERHSMQSVVRQAGLSMAIFALTGDVNSAAATLIILLPTFFIQSRYSRNLEWEADTYALEQMLERGLDTNKFADIMEKLLLSRGAEESGEADPDEKSFLEYFSTHPASAVRVERFRNAVN